MCPRKLPKASRHIYQVFNRRSPVSRSRPFAKRQPDNCLHRGTLRGVSSGTCERTSFVILAASCIGNTQAPPCQVELSIFLLIIKRAVVRVDNPSCELLPSPTAPRDLRSKSIRRKIHRNLQELTWRPARARANTSSRSDIGGVSACPCMDRSGAGTAGDRCQFSRLHRAH